MTTSNRLWILVVAVLAIAIVAFGWLLGISPKLDERSASESQLANVEANNQQLTIQTEQLKKDFTNLASISSDLLAIQNQLPANSNYPAFLSELNSLAAEHSISVQGVTFAAPTVFSASAEAAPVAEPSATADPAAAADPAAVTNEAPAGSTVAIPTTLTLAGSFDDLQSALGALQTGERLFLVSGFTFSGGGVTEDGSPSSDHTAAITGTLYVLTDGTTLIENAPTATPTPAATATPAP